MPETISKEVARRLVLGRQGLWPGRRWQGREGVEQAIRTSQLIQVDTISVVARNHDLALWSRVLDYREEWLNYWLYQERRFFEYGRVLMIYPLDEWPYWRTVMERKNRWSRLDKHDLPELVEIVRAQVAETGPMSSRDFKDRDRVSGGFNTVKDTTHALDHLWITGEFMVHSRRGFDRVYDLTEKLHPGEHAPDPLPSDATTDAFILEKVLRELSLATPSALARRGVIMLRRHLTPTECAAFLARLEGEGKAFKVKIEGLKETYYYPAEATPELDDLLKGEIPDGWKPLETDTRQEVNLLAPLDNVLWDRTRLKSLFDYDYVWEVYKPQPIRRWGYYTMPVLYGDKLVARLDPKLDRKTKKLTLGGFWLDDETLAEDIAFGEALAAGLARFARFHRATEVDTAVVAYPVLQGILQGVLK